MSLYNMLFGVDLNSTLFLEILGFTKESIPRYRNCFLEQSEDELNIVIHTRTGGGNRDYYDKPNEDNLDGPWNSDLRENPYYLEDKDDEFDSTYANFYFKIPNEILDKLNKLYHENPTIPPNEQWKLLFNSMEKESER